MRGYFMSSFTGKRDYEETARDAELTDAESAKGVGLKKARIIDPADDPELRSAVDNGFREVVRKWAKGLRLEDLPDLENVSMKDVIGPAGELLEAIAGTASGALIEYIKKHRDNRYESEGGKPGVSDAPMAEKKVKAILGNNPSGEALIEAIKLVTGGVASPTLQQQDLSLGDPGDVEYVALNEEKHREFLQILEGVNQSFLDLLTKYAILDNGGTVGEKQNSGDGAALGVTNTGRGFSGNPVISDFESIFNAATTGARKKSFSLRDSEGNVLRDPGANSDDYDEEEDYEGAGPGALKKTIQNVFEVLGQRKDVPIVQALQRAAQEFAAIYGGKLSEMGGKKGNFDRQTGLPAPEGAPNSAVTTYLEAYVRNAQNYMEELLRASVKGSAGDKDASDKAGGAEVPLDRIEGILDKLDIVPANRGYDIVELETKYLEDVLDKDTGEVLIPKGTIKTELTALGAQIVASTREAINKSEMPGGKLSDKPSFASTIAEKYGRTKLVEGSAPDNRTQSISLARIFADQENAEREAAKQTNQGLIQGLGAGVSEAEKACADLANGFIDSYEDKMQIESPSKRMKKAGEDTVKGLEEGLFQGMEGLDSAGRAMAALFHEGWSERQRRRFHNL
jgi:hypothetical protein